MLTQQGQAVRRADDFPNAVSMACAVPRELRAGLTTFLAMSHVIVVNPGVLSDAIKIPGVDNLFTQLVMVTCMAAVLGSLHTGLIARYPLAQALMLVGALMMGGARHIDWDDICESALLRPGEGGSLVALPDCRAAGRALGLALLTSPAGRGRVR